LRARAYLPGARIGRQSLAFFLPDPFWPRPLPSLRSLLSCFFPHFIQSHHHPFWSASASLPTPTRAGVAEESLTASAFWCAARPSISFLCSLFCTLQLSPQDAHPSSSSVLCRLFSAPRPVPQPHSQLTAHPLQSVRSDPSVCQRLATKPLDNTIAHHPSTTLSATLPSNIPLTACSLHFNGPGGPHYPRHAGNWWPKVCMRLLYQGTSRQQLYSWRYGFCSPRGVRGTISSNITQTEILSLLPQKAVQ
jgi:hypothetical protein